MNREQIRNYARFLIDEFTEAPNEGLFKDVADSEILFGVNDAINVAQDRVALMLARRIPRFFRKSKKVDVTINIAEYDIVDDWGITDYLDLEDIYLNESGEYTKRLLYQEHDQVVDNRIELGETKEPMIFTFEEHKLVKLWPTPPKSVVEKYKIYYFPEQEDLNHDTSDAGSDHATPAMPKICHPLIVLDTVKVLFEADSRATTGIEKRFDRRFTEALSFLDNLPGISTRGRGKLTDSIITSDD